MEQDASLPRRWNAYAPAGDYTITLLLFAWALLPAAFMLLLLFFNRYEEHRQTLAMVTYVLLVMVFLSGVGQRYNASRDPRIRLAGVVFLFTLAVWGLTTWLELERWWWVSYGLVLGCVPMLYIAMSHLASCTSLGIRRPWNAQHAVQISALPGWTVKQARWSASLMGWNAPPNGPCCVMFGAVVEGQTMLCFEALTPGSTVPLDAFGDVDWTTLSSEFSDDRAEE